MFQELGHDTGTWSGKELLSELIMLMTLMTILIMFNRCRAYERQSLGANSLAAGPNAGKGANLCFILMFSCSLISVMKMVFISGELSYRRQHCAVSFEDQRVEGRYIYHIPCMDK